jgi:transcriptional regulator with XRE-family HTH domain
MTDIARIVPKAKNAVNVRVGRNVRDIMFMRDVNQVRMALELGLTESQVSRRISGSVDWTPADIEKTAQVLDVRIERLFQELPELDSKVRTSDYMSASSTAIVTPIRAALSAAAVS